MRFMVNRTCLWLVLAAGMLFCQAGCITQTTSTAPRGTPLRDSDLPHPAADNGGGNGAPGIDTRSTAANEFSSEDSCAKRLDAICSAMIIYYSQHHELPPNLGVLRAEDPSLKLNCIENNLPYVYVSTGLRKSGQAMVMHDPSHHVEGTSRIVVYDPKPHPGGFRWCIRVVDTKPGQPFQAFVDRLNEPVFLAYQ